MWARIFALCFQLPVNLVFFHFSASRVAVFHYFINNRYSSRIYGHV